MPFDSAKSLHTWSPSALVSQTQLCASLLYARLDCILDSRLPLSRAPMALLGFSHLMIQILPRFASFCLCTFYYSPKSCSTFSFGRPRDVFPGDSLALTAFCCNSYLEDGFCSKGDLKWVDLAEI